MKDSSGAAIPQVDGQLHSATTFDRAIRSADHGVLEFTCLLVGRYRVEVSEKRVTTQSIDVALGAQRSVTGTVTLAAGDLVWKVDRF